MNFPFPYLARSRDLLHHRARKARNLRKRPMAQVHFTSHLRHVAPAEGVSANGATVAEALRDVFARHPTIKGYVLDDQDRVRLHIAVFVDGTHVRKNVLDYPLAPNSELYVMQALSGG
jgi:molybdopterin synthase sulfur carrier subunit